MDKNYVTSICNLRKNQFIVHSIYNLTGISPYELLARAESKNKKEHRGMGYGILCG